MRAPLAAFLSLMARFAARTTLTAFSTRSTLGAVATASLTAVATASLTAIPAITARRAVFTRLDHPRTPVLRCRTAALAVAPFAPRAIAAIAIPVASAGAAAPHLRGHRGGVAARADDLEALDLLALLFLMREDGDDGDSLDLELGLGPHDVADFCAALQKRTVQDALRLLRSSGAPRPASVVADAGQLDVDPAGHRAATLPLRASASAPEYNTGVPEKPLLGTRVLDFSRVLSGPFAGRMFADLGADVVKIEPPEGDMTRYWGEVRHGLSGFYVQQNAGKRNVCVDLKHPEGAELARSLAVVADVVIENYRPGVMGRLGLGWEALSSINPRLVMLSISGFGATGPDSDRAAYATVVQAESGWVSRQSEFDAMGPTDAAISVADMNAGLHGMVAVLSALLMRERTGRGQWIDMSMLDSMLCTDDYMHHAADQSPVARQGGEFWDAPGGPILIAGDFRYVWRQTSSVHALADPSPAGADIPTKAAARRRAFAGWVLGFRERGALVAALDAANIPWADVVDHRRALDTPQAAARGVVAVVDDRGGGERRVVQSPYRFSDAEAGVAGPPPFRGEHNAEVLEEWLGIAATSEALQAE